MSFYSIDEDGIVGGKLWNVQNASNIMWSNAVAGDFPCLRAYFHLERRLRAYILTTYLPSFLVVLLSWLSFWIDLESAPARTSLSILTILTITTQSSGLLRSMPAGSFTKAIDVWMATCLVFVFGAFIEYSIVNTLARRQKAKTREGATIAGLLSATAAATLPLQPASSSNAALAFGARTQRVRHISHVDSRFLTSADVSLLTFYDCVMVSW